MSKKFYPLASPDIRQTDIDNVVEVLQSGMLVQGKNVASFEADVQKYLGVDHAICVSNGTATMHLALVCLGIGPGDEVIVPAFSYVATANVVELVGAKPVFVDIEIDTFNINVSQISEAITDKTKAIIPVHEFGLAANIIDIVHLLESTDVHIIEDAACALGAKERDQFVGTFGTVGSFSLHPRKAITSGEGGIITTNDAEIASKLRILRNHGISMESGEMAFVEAGFNYRMTDMQAALVINQLTRVDEIIAKRQSLYEVYHQELTNQLITIPPSFESKRATWQTFHVLLDDSLNQQDVIKHLREHGIQANYGAQCIPDQPFYKKKYALDCKTQFPNAYRAYKKGLALPLYEKLNKEDIKYISTIINQITN